MSALERNPQVPAPTPHKVLGPGVEGRGIPRGPRATRIDWPFLRPPERVPEAPVVSRDHLPQLEKFQVVLRSRRDQADFHCGVSRLITSVIWNFQRFLHTLAATQEVPRHTRLHSRGSSRVPPTSRGAPFLPHSSKGGILSMRGGERIPGVPVVSQEEALCTGKARGNPGSCHHSQSPQMSHSIPGKPVFPALPRLTSRGSTHTTVARGTVLWVSLVG